MREGSTSSITMVTPKEVIDFNLETLNATAETIKMDGEGCFRDAVGSNVVLACTPSSIYKLKLSTSDSAPAAAAVAVDQEMDVD